MRVLFVVICACVAVALSQPETGGVYLPVAPRDSANRRYSPAAGPDPGRRYRGSGANNPSSRRYLPVGRSAPRAKTPSPPPRRPFVGGPAPIPFPSDLIPEAQFRPDPFQAPEVAPYQPSSAEVPPNQAAFSYQPNHNNQAAPSYQPNHNNQAASRRYLPVAAKDSASRARGRTQYQAPTSGSGYGSGPEPAYPPASYDFEYNVLDAESGNDFGQREGRRGDLVTGRYRVVLPDGRTQVVEYVADMQGYRPVVSYEGEASTRGGDEGYSYNKPGGADEGYSYNQPRQRS